MADYDNSRYTYAQVLAGTGYYMKEDRLRYPHLMQPLAAEAIPILQ